MCDRRGEKLTDTEIKAPSEHFWLLPRGFKIFKNTRKENIAILKIKEYLDMLMAQDNKKVYIYFLFKNNTTLKSVVSSIRSQMISTKRVCRRTCMYLCVCGVLFILVLS